MSKYSIVTALIFTSFLIASCGKPTYLGIGFYNVENLFDTIDDPITKDEQFLPSAEYQWNTEKYISKLNNLSDVISELDHGKPPAFLGLCEVENKLVVDDLIATSKLKKTPYHVVHHQSSDVRGIDVSAIFDQTKFTFVDSGYVVVNLSEYHEITRDILWIKLKPKKGGDLYFVINHWPSRRGGTEESEPKRIKAAQALADLCTNIHAVDSAAEIVIMGDFNDEPSDMSIMKTLQANGQIPTSNSQFFNAMFSLDSAGKGSYCYRGDWNMLDQIILSKALIDGKSWDYRANSAYIMDFEWLRQHSEKYEGYPLRTFGGPTYLNGYSDHFPVLIHLQRLPN